VRQHSASVHVSRTEESAGLFRRPLLFPALQVLRHAHQQRLRSLMTGLHVSLFGEEIEVFIDVDKEPDLTLHTLLLIDEPFAVVLIDQRLSGDVFGVYGIQQGDGLQDERDVGRCIGLVNVNPKILEMPFVVAWTGRDVGRRRRRIENEVFEQSRQLEQRGPRLMIEIRFEDMRTGIENGQQRDQNDPLQVQ
jgi:hypothetical protein